MLNEPQMRERQGVREAVAVSSHLAENQPSNEIEIRPDPPPLLSLPLTLPSPCSIYFSSQSGNYCRGFSALVGFLRSVGCRLSIWFLRRSRGRKGGDTSRPRPRTTEEVFFLAPVVAPSPFLPPSLSAIWCADSFQISFPLLPRRCAG